MKINIINLSLIYSIFLIVTCGVHGQAYRYDLTGQSGEWSGYLVFNTNNGDVYPSNLIDLSVTMPIANFGLADVVPVIPYLPGLPSGSICSLLPSGLSDLNIPFVTPDPPPYVNGAPASSFSCGSSVAGSWLSYWVSGYSGYYPIESGGTWSGATIVSPQITTQPANQTSSPGSSTSLTASASGQSPLAFQWLFNGVNVYLATNLTLLLNNPEPADAGSYQLVASNVYGAVTSSPAFLSLSNVPVAFSVNGGVTRSSGKTILILQNLTGQGAFVVQASSNLITWFPILTNVPAYGQLTITDNVTSNYSTLFYRTHTINYP